MVATPDSPLPAYRGAETYVFVCYAHENSGEVYPEIVRLQSAGTRLWYDEGIAPGHEWTQEIADAIDGAARVLYFVSPAAVASRHCRNEIQYALGRGKHVVSVHLEPTTLPGGLELSIGLDQAILKHRLQEQAYRDKLSAALAGAPAAPSAPAASASEADRVSPPARRKRAPWLAAAAAAVLVAGGAWLWQGRVSTAPASVPPATAPAGAPITAIAVMPFIDLSPGQDQQWFANGMAAELIESLGRIEALHVPSRTSTELLARQGADLASIGTALAVGSVVTGTIMAAGERLNVVAEWTRIDDRARLWSARYERRTDELLDVQRELAVGIAEAIRTELGVNDAAASLFLRERYQTSDPRAWALAQQAWALFQTWVPENWPRARLLARDALALDPDYAAVHGMLGNYDVNDPEARLQAALRALEIDPTDTWGHTILIEDANWDYATREALLNRALENDPGNSILHWEAYFIYAGTGRAEEALAATQRMVELDPLWPAWFYHHGNALTYVGRFAQARDAYIEGQRVLAVRGPGYQPFLHFVFSSRLANVHHALGDVAAAHAASLSEAGLQIAGLPPAEVVAAWRGGGWQGYNLLMAERIPDWAADARCRYLAHAGDAERMYACLEDWLADTMGPWTNRQGLSSRSSLAIGLHADPAFADYRPTPRFQQLLAELQQRMADAAGTYLLPATLR